MLRTRSSALETIFTARPVTGQLSLGVCVSERGEKSARHSKEKLPVTGRQQSEESKVWRMENFCR